MGTLHPHVLKYVGDRIQRGEITATTARNIRNHLWQFATSFGDRPLDQLGQAALDRWMVSMRRQQLADSTIALRISSVRTFARWCVQRRIVAVDWTTQAPKIRRTRQVPRDLTNDHFWLILDHATTDRTRLLVWLMFGCGLRCIEISRLHVDDYDPVTGLLHVTGKAGHHRHVPVPDPVVRAMHTYLAPRHSTGPLVRVEDGTRALGHARISALVGNTIRAAGIKLRNYDGRSAHGLRAAAASDLLDHADGDLRVAQQFLGHANLATTSIYLRRAHTERVRDAQNARMLRRAA